MSTTTEETPATGGGALPGKPRGTCTGTGCGFEYTLVRASRRATEPTVVRNHNSRIGPGKCDGALKLPKEAAADPVAAAELADPAPDDRPPLFTAGYDSEGSCGHDITEGDEIRADGEGGFLCRDCAQDEPRPDRPQHLFEDGSGATWVHDGLRESCALPECAPATVPHPGYEPSGAPVPGMDAITSAYQEAVQYPTVALPAEPPQLADPAPMPAELPPVSGQPEPDRDRWGRYRILGESHTRATSFAKLGSSTFALGEWNERMLIKGLTERPDLLALAHGLEVKRDKNTLNRIADDAQAHAGNKVAANIGTAYHKFTERLDAGLITLDDVPPAWRARCGQYVSTLAQYGLTTRREWIERSTAVRADQVSAPVPVAGTLDRILQLPNGELVIGDLKTSSNIEYAFVEIAVQLAIYAHGVNTFGLFDWNTKTWHPAPGPVRTDYAIVVHLPADGDGCFLYRIDLVKGWAYAQVSGRVQARQKDESVAAPLTALEFGPAPAPQPAAESAHLSKALNMCSVADTEGLGQLYGYAESSGVFSPAELDCLRMACGDRWVELNEVPY